LNKIPVSFFVLTKNEEQDLPTCLKSAERFGEIIVLDSLSTDRTAEIAREFGATVVERPFDNWSAHQNWAMQNIPFKYPWIYYSDADEVLPKELVDEIEKVAVADSPNSAYRLPRRDYFYGRWLKHVVPSPFNIRLFRPSKIRYERLTNPVSIVDGPIGLLTQHFNHYPFSKGMTHWFAKHNSYSTQEAQQIVANMGKGEKPSLMIALRGKDVYERRVHQKAIFHRLPMRPLVNFLILYVGKLGFLDGVPGFRYAALRTIYEYMIVLKTKEILGKRDSLPG